MTVHCTNHLNSHRRCGELLTTVRLNSGRSVSLCVRCRWRDEGRCWQCGATRTNHRGRGVYCERCARLRVMRSNAVSRHKPESKARRKDYDRERYLRRAA